MAQVNVISVNPSKQTLGALNIESIEKMARSYNPNATPSLQLPGLKTLCNFIFGINRSVTAAWSKKLAIVRSLAAVLFIAISFSLSATLPFGSSLPTAAMIIGVMMILGVFERLASFAGAAYCAVIAAFAIPAVSDAPMLTEHIMNPAVLLCIATSCGLFVVSMFGPGRFSVDQILNTLTYKFSSAKLQQRHDRNRQRQAEMRLSYKAWRSSK